MISLVLASGNPGKVAEFRRLLPPGFGLLSASDLSLEFPAETGSSFEENAVAKARFAAETSGYLAIADDSGLEVDALGGAPGIYSARYSGELATDEQNIEKVLQELRDVASNDRSARFRCVVALAAPDGLLKITEGSVEGTIGERPIGSQGFGYDPIFIVRDHRSFGQLTREEKDALSHRGIAFRSIASYLANMKREE